MRTEPLGWLMLFGAVVVIAAAGLCLVANDGCGGFGGLGGLRDLGDLGPDPCPLVLGVVSVAILAIALGPSCRTTPTLAAVSNRFPPDQPDPPPETSLPSAPRRV